MDVNSLTSDNKHNKGDQKKDERSSSRSICDLPNHILQLIVSCLPTKDAIRTSVLSKEWLHLWKHGVSKIELEEVTCDPYKRQQFIECVKRLLLVCDCTNLKKFSLSFEVGQDDSLVTEWLRGFIKPEIQELSLCLKGLDSTVVFPDELFKCVLLTQFQLSMRDILVLPYYPIQFQSLRTLTLEYVIFYPYSADRLFCGCPCLEELTLIDCDWQDLEAVTFSFPLLQKITIRESKEDDHDNTRRNRCQLWIIGTNNLKLFSYEGVHKNDYFLYSSTSVINASIKIHPDFIVGDSKRKAVAYFVLYLLRELTSVETLSISYNSLMAINTTSSLIWHLPLFSNLAELCLVSMSPENLYCDALLIVLKNSPCLQVINFQGGVFLPKDRADCEMHSLCICFREHLKTIKVNRFLGFETELFAIQILLRSALVLDKLYVCCDPVAPYLRSECLKYLRYEIESFPRASMDCEIEFENFEVKM